MPVPNLHTAPKDIREIGQTQRDIKDDMKMA